MRGGSHLSSARAALVADLGWDGSPGGCCVLGGMWDRSGVEGSEKFGFWVEILKKNKGELKTGTRTKTGPLR